MMRASRLQLVKVKKPLLHVRLHKGLLALLVLFCVSILLGLGADLFVRASSKSQIVTSAEEIGETDADCILVLGCLVRRDGSPSDMLADRLDAGIELYKSGKAPKLLMSGDHGRIEYDEVNAMKGYALRQGVCSEDVFMDHAGFSTYDSLYRAKEVFGAKKILIVSQGYHLYRALYIAKRLGIEAKGVCADQRSYGGQRARDMREILARGKDFVGCIFDVKPRYLGERISLSQSGNLTNDASTEVFLEDTSS